MAAKPVALVGGDFVGNGAIHFGVLWSGPQADKFHGVSFKTPKVKYAPADVVKLSELGQEQVKSFLGASVTAAAGALFLGGIGLIAGALAGGNKRNTIAAIEFSDGRKCAFSIDPTDRVYMCLKLFAIENRLLQHSF